jgi:hypothetical protein
MEETKAQMAEKSIRDLTYSGEKQFFTIEDYYDIFTKAKVSFSLTQSTPIVIQRVPQTHIRERGQSKVIGEVL